MTYAGIHTNCQYYNISVKSKNRFHTFVFISLLLGSLMKLCHNIDIRSITAVKEYYSDQYLADLKNELERFDKSEIIVTNRNKNERIFSERNIDMAISSSLATTLLGYEYEIDLNYPKHSDDYNNIFRCYSSNNY